MPLALPGLLVQWDRRDLLEQRELSDHKEQLALRDQRVILVPLARRARLAQSGLPVQLDQLGPLALKDQKVTLARLELPGQRALLDPLDRSGCRDLKGQQEIRALLG